MTGLARDYAPILSDARPIADRDEAMLWVVSRLWRAFGAEHAPAGSRAMSWVGFYLKSPDAPEMVLVCREPKPACSPIGLHGLCGQGWHERRAMVVRDVRTLGAGYIACDPRDQSELVVPMIAPDGSCVGVLDADSHDVDAFDAGDAANVSLVLERVGLSRAPKLVPVSR